ncbi:MAG TPA: ribose 5-phosphate isomerase B [Anaerolineaceae bacterium]|nr:ribose 5-phosphate isomerase B [Anaerolineaceae bacterium]
MRIVIGSDHIGYPLKEYLIPFLKGLGLEVKDCGTNSRARTDYPIYAKKVAAKIISGEYDRGILICGSGVGMSITANKNHGIRAVVCSEPYSAVVSRKHNNSNILCMGSRVVGEELAEMIVQEWLNVEYEGGRHQNRLDMIEKLEDKY